MVAVSLSNLHPDLKLGLVLVAAAALLNVVGLGSFGTEEYAPLESSVTWLILPTVIGGLAVIPAAIWVDRWPPHKMMVAGAVVAAFGLSILVLSNTLAVNALGMFVLQTGSSVAGMLVFYAVAVKGATRYKGTLIGALGMVFTMRLGERIFREWSLDAPMVVLGIGVALALSGAVVLFYLLPRVFAGSFEPGRTLRETLAVPSVRRAAVWVTVTYFIAYMAMSTMVVAFSVFRISRCRCSQELKVFCHNTRPWPSLLASASYSGASPPISIPCGGCFSSPPSCYCRRLGLSWRSTALARRLRVPGLGLVRGGLVCLPWVLMAELLPIRHFAKIALGVVFVGSLFGGALGPLLWGALTVAWVVNAAWWIIPVLGIALAVVASRLPRTRAAGRPRTSISKI